MGMLQATISEEHKADIAKARELIKASGFVLVFALSEYPAWDGFYVFYSKTENDERGPVLLIRDQQIKWVKAEDKDYNAIWELWGTYAA